MFRNIAMIQDGYIELKCANHENITLEIQKYNLNMEDDIYTDILINKEEARQLANKLLQYVDDGYLSNVGI